MTANGWIQIALFSVIVIAITRPLGGYMTRVFAGERTFLWPVLRPVERAVYWCCGVDEKEEQHWLTYAVAMLLFSVAGFVTLYALQRLQWYLPFNPQGQTAVEQSLAFNTSVSFITNTNWQAYGGETTMSYLVQMAGLTVHNFVSAATGIAMALALIRGFVRREAKVDRQFLGRSDPLHALHPDPDLDRRRAGAGLAGGAAEPRRLYRGDDARRGETGHRARPGRLAGDHQGARHQWRRVLQRQLGASVREPERDHQPDRAGRDLRDRRRVDQCVGPHGHATSARAGQSLPRWGCCSSPA